MMTALCAIYYIRGEVIYNDVGGDGKKDGGCNRKEKCKTIGQIIRPKGSDHKNGGETKESKE